jgi:uroporphyrinogen decarboxylase-like protein
MTDRERMLAAIRGEAPDRLPWIPRLEFWHRAQVRKGSLPQELRSLSLIEIADRLGAGYYSVIPDYTDCRDELDMIDRGLGIHRLAVLPYKTTLEGVERKVIQRGREKVVEYHTPVGSIRTVTVFTDEMLDAGASTPYTTEHAIREPKDFDVVGYIFSRIKVEPQTGGYCEQRARVGDRGIVVAFTSGAACPIHHILKEFMPLEQFVYAWHDYPGKVEKLVEEMEPFYEGMKRCAADSPAEVVMLGANYDDSITHPPFFRKHILPVLRNYADVLHRNNKFLMTHTDGESRKLLPSFVEAGFDVADSVCPHPMTSVRIEEFLEAFEGRTTVMGGIPAILLCRDSSTADDCDRYISDLVERHGRRTRLILGVSDMVTADADWDRLRRVTAKVTGYGS